jgi:hypothetical protein
MVRALLITSFALAAAVFGISSCAAGAKAVSPHNTNAAKCLVDWSKIEELQEQCRYDQVPGEQIAVADSFFRILSDTSHNVPCNEKKLMLYAAELGYMLALEKKETVRFQSKAMIFSNKLSNERLRLKAQADSCGEEIKALNKEIKTYKDLIKELEKVKNR